MIQAAEWSKKPILVQQCMVMNILDSSKCGTLDSDVQDPDNMISDISGDRNVSDRH